MSSPFDEGRDAATGGYEAFARPAPADRLNEEDYR